MSEVELTQAQADEIRSADRSNEPVFEPFALLDTWLTEASIGTALLDRDLRLRRINTTLAALFGLQGSDQIGHALRHAAPDVAAVLEPLLRGVLASGAPLQELPLTLPAAAEPGERASCWLLSAYLVRTSGGEIDGVNIVVISEEQLGHARGAADSALARTQEARRTTERAVSHVTRLQEIDTALKTALTPKRIAKIAVEMGAAALGATAALLMTCTQEGCLQLEHAAGFPAEQIADWRSMATDRSSPIAEAARTMQTLWITSPSDARSDARAQCRQYAASPMNGDENGLLAVIPLTRDGRALGVLAMLFARHLGTRAEIEPFFVVLSQRTALALERAGRMRSAALQEVTAPHPDLQEAERPHLRPILDQMPVGVILAEAATGMLVYANRETERILGHPFVACTCSEEYSRWRALRPNGTPLPPRECPLARSLFLGEEIHGEEVVIARDDGVRITCLVNAAPLRSAEGQVVAGVVALSDISARKAVENALLERETLLQDLNLRLRRTMTEMHHRIKNNLQIIVDLVELQVSEIADATATPCLQRVADHARTLATLHDLLAQEAAYGRDTPLVSSRALLDGLLGLLQQTLTGRKIQTRLDDIRLPSRECAALSMLVNELVTNAVKHGGGTVSVTLQESEGRIRLEIDDEGSGFPAGFTPGTNAHVGLQLVESMAHWDLRGDIVYSNRSEGGAHVLVTFPATAIQDM